MHRYACEAAFFPAGMTANQIKNKVIFVMFNALYSSPLGDIELAMDCSALTALRFSRSGSFSSSNWFPPSSACAALLADVFRWLDLYFSGAKPDFTPALRPQGTPFQCGVWQALSAIPYGSAVTYGDIARRVGCRSAQAVGQAIERNPIAIIIPCHRVVGANGSLTGYAYGTELKRKLLELECVEIGSWR